MAGRSTANGGGRPSRAFWAGKRVLLTGHTGFKGAWAARMLAQLGADVTGFSLPAEGGPTAYGLLGVQAGLAREVLADLADAGALRRAVEGADIVLHLAAQAIVSQGYAQPAQTWASNVTGTLNLLDGLRGSHVQAAVLVTSDKVYRNDSAARPFVESDALGGDDPYSASKAACEILVASHRASFADLPPIATARAGNVIGGGDFGRDRLIPDLVRANAAGAALVLRNPDATRPFQHVLDVLSGYLVLAQSLCDAAAVQVGAVNFGPAEAELSVRDVLGHWGAAVGAPVNWQLSTAPPMLEKSRLALDSALAKSALGWAARKDTRAAIAGTARWYQAWAQGADMAARSDAAIIEYLEE
jgi:CDP-glucose 4,6-dehydratase